MEKGSSQPGHSRFVNARCTSQGVFPEFVNEVLLAHNDAGLWATQELITREEGQGDAGSNAVLNHRLRAQTKPGGIQETTAPQIIQHGQIVPCPQFGDFIYRYFLGEPDYLEVA